MAKAEIEHTEEIWTINEAFDYLTKEVDLQDYIAVREMNEQICAGYLAMKVNGHSPPPTLWVDGTLVLRLVGGRPVVVVTRPLDPGPYLYTVAPDDMRRLWPLKVDGPQVARIKKVLPALYPPEGRVPDHQRTKGVYFSVSDELQRRHEKPVSLDSVARAIGRRL
jgi:hypothetical protein